MHPTLKVSADVWEHFLKLNDMVCCMLTGTLHRLPAQVPAERRAALNTNLNSNVFSRISPRTTPCCRGFFGVDKEPGFPFSDPLQSRHLNFCVQAADLVRIGSLPSMQNGWSRHFRWYWQSQQDLAGDNNIKLTCSVKSWNDTTAL